MMAAKIKITIKIWLRQGEWSDLRYVVRHIRRRYPDSEIRLTKSRLCFNQDYSSRIAEELRGCVTADHSRLAAWIAEEGARHGC